uniref:Uncharacterized protein n=1 Tax=Romanomermis culicivorax TaxID=13658 RepID=A0A915J970_ROMCU
MGPTTFSSVKDLGGASMEEVVTPGSKERFFVEGMGDLDLLFEFEGEDDKKEIDDVRCDFGQNYSCCANYDDGGYWNFWNVQ